MKLRWTLIPQLAALGVQILLPAMPDFPQHYVPLMHALVSFFQMASALIAHQADNSGSSGSPPPTDFIPEVKMRFLPKRKLDGDSIVDPTHGGDKF